MTSAPFFSERGITMPAIFEKIDKIRPAYDFTYKATMVVCKLLLIADILITSMAVAGRYIPFIPDPSWSEEVVLTVYVLYGCSFSSSGYPQRSSHPYDCI